MAKRKYEKDDEQPSKKKKSLKIEAVTNETNVMPAEQPQNDTEDQGNPVKSYNFDVKHFRKELSGKQGQTMALTQFLQVCMDPDIEVDYIEEYLKCGGNCHEILRQINQDSKKNLSLATPAFHIFHLIILKVQSSLPHLIPTTEEACRYFLNTFMPTVESMVNENSGPRHRKIILKLLTSMVTLNPDLGIEILNQAPLSPKNLQLIIKKTNYKEKDNVRTTFVHFMTSFLVEERVPLIKAFLEKQGLMALVIPGLVQDEASSVLIFLNILKKNVIDNQFISKSLKLKTFSHQVLHNMFKVYSWKGPPDLSIEDRNKILPDIVNLLTDILTTLFTSHKLGIYFIDNSLGTDVANKNQNLYRAILTLNSPWENENEGDAIIQIVYKCPDLYKAVVTVIEKKFEPNHSIAWQKTIEFFMKLINEFKPEQMIVRMSSLSPTQVAHFIIGTTLPALLLKHIRKNLEKDNILAVYCIKVLVKMLQTLKHYMQLLQMDESNLRIDKLKSSLDYVCTNHLPSPSLIVTLIKNVLNEKEDVETNENSQEYKLSKLNAAESMLHLVDLLLLYGDIYPAFLDTIGGSLNMKKLLNFCDTISDDCLSLLRFKIVSLWILLDSSTVSLRSSMFKELLLIILEFYTSDLNNTWYEAEETLRHFLKNTSIFETDEGEINLMLYTLRNSKINQPSVVADIVEYVIENSKDLNDNIRNQMVHFQTPDASSEMFLNKLFDDLMDNRSTEDSEFIERKIPSIFIAGCVQYVQNNKDVKKQLKHFLSLYVANLLHSNYSPEMTEVLMGDCKLDSKSYITSWMTEPAALPDTVVGKDLTILNISKSVIGTEEISLEAVFPFLDLSSIEDSDVTVNNVSYKFRSIENLVSSQILIWANYLIFCLIRLTNLNQLKETQQKKIGDYFECLIVMTKKFHMIDICRTMMINMYNNPHIVKIYQTFDLNKNESSVLATKFLTQALTQHVDMVNYLNRDGRLLKLYQQKNYNEIVKAFIKIHKRKNADCSLILSVLKVIGLSKEDDLRVINQIVTKDFDSCVKDDKEPTFVLEILRVLIEKYSTNINTEIQHSVLKNIIKLYVNLLKHKDVTANLTNIEHALVNYFDNNPYQCKNITDDNFKEFFNVINIRKSTSLLASTILKYNQRLCSVYKEQIVKPEILSQRELTLPLGNAVVHHSQYLLDNKELLEIIYKEYKSNISKLLEKPHKAGQIYISCWRLIRKLVIECMDFKDCKNIFAKNHKFETVEMSHVKLLQAVFLKLCLTEDGKKKEYLINYFLNTINILTMALRESKETNILNDIISNIYEVARLCESIEGFEVDKKDEFKKVTESAIWQNFYKAVLKDTLKIKRTDRASSCGPQLLCLLTRLVNLFYPDHHEDTVTLFDMVTSHSEFLNVMLSRHSSGTKSRLIAFIYTLIKKNDKLMKHQHLPVYLSAYHATTSPCDRLLLSLLHFYESRGQPLNEYKPYLWGDSAANYYAVRKNKNASLWAHPKPSQIINLFEKDTVERTIRNFPVMQKLEYDFELPSNMDADAGVASDDSAKKLLDEISKDSAIKTQISKPTIDNEAAIAKLIANTRYMKRISELKDVDLKSVSHTNACEDIYDPAFVLPLLSHILEPVSLASSFRLLRTGLLSLPVMALSSNCPSMRAAAYHVLHRFCMLLDSETKHKNDKLLLSDFMETLRHSLASAVNVANAEDPFADTKNPRLPAVAALYLAKAIKISTAPFDPLYKPVNNFLIAKQFVDLTVVPDFLSLFHDSDVEFSERRLWILDMMKDGTKTMTDVNVVFKTMCLKMIMDFYTSTLSDRRAKEKIIGVLISLVSIPRAMEILVEGHGLVSWLHSVVRQLHETDKSLTKQVLKLLRTMHCSMLLNSFSRCLGSAKNGVTFEKIADVKGNKDVEYDIVMIVNDLLDHLSDIAAEELTPHVEVFKLYLRKKNIQPNKQHSAILQKLIEICGTNKAENR